MIKLPYLLFLGNAPDQLSAKVAQGISDWRPENCIGQFTLDGCQADVGLPDISLQRGRELGAKTLVIGVANRGGVIDPIWKETLVAALRLGYDIANGLHKLLRDDEDLVAVAQQYGCLLHDVRLPNRNYPIANGEGRRGKRVLGVGTDCSIGKMYTALALEKSLRKRGAKATFRATGQTGILITGAGVPLDAVIADFMAGAIEWLTPENDEDHWDVVEGQGSLFHISYSGITLALLHGAQPDALVLCHEPTRQNMRGLTDRTLPSLETLRDAVLPLARISNPSCEVIGVSVDTHRLSEAEADSYLGQIEQNMGLPAVDPVRNGADRLAATLV
ncbi:MAG: DUF1611 domain-containing protein [Aestuariivita sp.]|nr:DUF1611 domain-containing protein [Aestuariivita sp.]MCY4204083.1 DUF1611 domain-containing protein [Aestuariivita sp.]MCY4286967.1 DUF1611 domain-containing protein [Aestuariivita sp.]MCY4348005.1 DUF1611 domain-containing protein [Aestuariivita sp.]